jgi:hypothetical protein
VQAKESIDINEEMDGGMVSIGQSSEQGTIADSTGKAVQSQSSKSDLQTELRRVHTQMKEINIAWEILSDE